MNNKPHLCDYCGADTGEPCPLPNGKDSHGRMCPRWKNLAYLIWTYNGDVPYKENEKVTLMPREYFEEAMDSEHAGDCTNISMTCRRCFADEAIHMAKWLIKQQIREE